MARYFTCRFCGWRTRIPEDEDPRSYECEMCEEDDEQDQEYDKATQSIKTVDPHPTFRPGDLLASGYAPGTCSVICRFCRKPIEPSTPVWGNAKGYCCTKCIEYNQEAMTPSLLVLAPNVGSDASASSPIASTGLVGTDYE